MMHECPRCGFIQPKDRYCANCGLDIDHFKPAPRPLLRRVTESTMFQACLAVLIVLGLGSWIYLAQKKTIDEKLKGALNLASPNVAAPPTPETESPSADNPQENTNEPPPPSPTPSARTNAPAPSTTTTTSPSNSTTETRPAATSAKEFNVQFVELSRLYLSQLAQENQILDETATTRSIVLNSQPNVTALRDKDPEANILPGGDTHSIRVNRVIHLDYMHIVGGPNEVAGMTLEITPSATLEQSTEFTVNGTITLRAPDGNATNHGFEGKYVLPHASTLLISGILPHQPIRPEDQEHFAGTPLVIFSSPEFVNNVSELVLMIQPK